jgi:hypothetical protein
MPAAGCRPDDHTRLVPRRPVRPGRRPSRPLVYEIGWQYEFCRRDVLFEVCDLGRSRDREQYRSICGATRQGDLGGRRAPRRAATSASSAPTTRARDEACRALQILLRTSTCQAEEAVTRRHHGCIDNPSKMADRTMLHQQAESVTPSGSPDGESLGTSEQLPAGPCHSRPSFRPVVAKTYPVVGAAGPVREIDRGHRPCPDRPHALGDCSSGRDGRADRETR